MDAIDLQVDALKRRIKETEYHLRALQSQLRQAEVQAQSSRHAQQLQHEWQDEVMAALGQSDTDPDSISVLSASPSMTRGEPALRVNPHDRSSHSEGLEQAWQEEVMAALSPSTSPEATRARWPRQHFALSGEEYRRYGRQLIMPEIGLQGQRRLRSSSVLVVGVGGLGCPAAAYLAGAGIGTLGLIDGDTVEVSNLHRQIAHSTKRVGMSKVESASEYVKGLNPHVKIVPFREHLSPQEALRIFQQFDLVLDCTDHPTSRYLISDTCVLAGKPLVSASALRTEGQLMVLNNPPRRPGESDGGPCYRCVFPKPPPAESVVSCGEGGILGPVVGVMGILQALEAIKLISKGIDIEQPPCDLEAFLDAPSPVSTSGTKTAASPTLLLFSAYSTPQFRSVRLRSRRSNCASCSAACTVTPDSLSSGSMDYVAFCGVTQPIRLLSPEERISATEFAALAQANSKNVLLDVRDPTQFELCSLPGSINIPWSGFAQQMKENQDELQGLKNRDVFIVCKLGNDSQLAVQTLKEMNKGGLRIRDIEGGFRAWRKEVDPSWPDI